MMNFKKWVSYELISKKLLSARAFSFFDEELSDEEPADRGTLVTASQPAILSVNTPQSSNTQVTGIPASTHVPSETSDVVQKDYNNKNSDLLTKLEGLQIKFLRLIHRIGFSPEDIVVSQVLFRLQLGTLIRAGETDLNRPGINITKARAIAAEQEATDKPNLDFPLRILVLGKTGVGKSATLNSLLDQAKAATDAFHPTTNHIQEVYGTIKGIKVSIIDTPGLSSSGCFAERNRKVLLAIRRFIRKSPPDIVLYFERLDFINRGYSDYPLLKLITETFGSSIWFNTILVMTHSSSPLPEGPDGNPANYDAFVHQCKSIIQHYICQTVSNMQLDIPVSLVENHPLCRKNTRGEKILPNGKAWLSQLLLLCLATKVLGDANSLLKFQESFQLIPDGRLPSLPHLLSSILRTRSRPGADDSDEDMMNDHFDDNEEDYDKLPAFRRLSKLQFQKLSDAQRSAYLDELYYRETLYLKKQWKEELLRRRECIKSDTDSSTSYNEHDNTSFDDAIQVSDMSIPLSFDSDHPSYRYRCLLGNSPWLFRPVLDPQGWDHDVGFDGVSLEGSQSISILHASFVGQMSKDREDINVQTECAAKYVHPKSHSYVAEVDIQTAGRVLVCTVSGDAKFYNFRYNKTGGGLSVTKYGNNYFFGAKVEDSLSIGKRFMLTMNMGQIRGCGQAAHGGNVEATFKGRDYPVREDKMTLGTTILCFDKEMVIGASVQSDFRLGRAAKMSFNANLNSRRLGQVSIKASTSDHMEIALVAVISLFNVIFRRKGKDIAN